VPSKNREPIPEPILAIDFGTTTSSAILVTDGREDVDIEEPFGGERAWPSAVCLDNGKLVTGSEAEQRGRVHPECFRAEFKLELGRPNPANLGGRAHSMTQLIAAVLGDMKAAAEEAAEAPVSRAVLTVPAGYGPRDKRNDLMIEAAKAAGFAAVELIPEPVAAALAPAAGAPIRPGSLLLVYDLGGGTFDTALVRVGAQGTEVLGYAAINNGSGGRDIDSALAQELVAAGGDQLAALAGSERGRLQLGQHTDELKRQLSVRKTASVYFGSTDIMLTATRDQLDRLTLPLIERTLECVSGMLAARDTALTDVDALLLVGGATRMPVVATTVRDRLGLKPRTATHPQLAVVAGAARFAAAAGTRFALPRRQRTPERPLRWQLPGGSATLLDWSVAKGDRFASGQELGQVRLGSGAIWALRADRPGRVLSVHALRNATVHSGDWLVTAEALPPSTLPDPQDIINISMTADINALSFLPSGRQFVTGLANGVTSVTELLSWSASSAPRATELSSTSRAEAVLAVSLSSDGELFATASSDGNARIWDSRTGDAMHRFHCGSTVNGVSFGPDGRKLATAGDCLYVWDIASGAATMLRAGAAQGVCFSPAGGAIAAVFRSEHKALVVNSATGAVVTAVESRDSAGFVTFGPDGARFAGGRDADSVAIWDVSSGEAIAVLPHRGARGAAFSPDGTICATAGSDQYAALWDAATGQELSRIRHPASVHTVAFGAGGSLLAAAGGDRRVRIWQINR
jgi:WD40 repeat protein/actin-like ATPase involved in cell morphogenesis